VGVFQQLGVLGRICDFSAEWLKAVQIMCPQSPMGSSVEEVLNDLQPNIADVTVSTMLFGRGARAHLFVSWLHPYKEQRLVVVGERRMAVFDDVRKTEKLQSYDDKIDLVNFVVEKPQGTPVAFAADQPLALEYRHFLESVSSTGRRYTNRGTWGG
jgi:predicted dehydrogenase